CADALQDAFLAAFRSIGSFEGSSGIGTWFYRIVVNACLGKLRSQYRHRECSIDELLPAFDESGHHLHPVSQWSDQAYSCIVSAETRTLVRECIDRLPDSYRSILLLRDIEELDTEQTAVLLGISVTNVKTRLHRARQALRTLLEPMFLT